MTGRRPGPRRSLALRAAVVATITVVLVWLTPAAAEAGPGLVTSDPAEGAALAGAPAAVLLTFSSAPDPALSHVAARDDAGHDVGSGTAVRAGGTGLRLTVAITAAGDYTVAFHVVFDDGHDATGFVRFSVGTGVAPSGPAPVAAAEAPHTGHEHGVDSVSAVLLIADLLVVIAVPAMLLRTRRRA